MRLIKVFKRRWYGKLVLVGEYSDNHYDIVISTDGVLTIRSKYDTRSSKAAFNKGEWSVCVNLGDA